MPQSYEDYVVEAEQALEVAGDARTSTDERAIFLRRAQVYATLALAAVQQAKG